MSSDDPATGPGTTSDPNQASKTGLPKKDDVKPKTTRDDSNPEDATRGPGSTSDPNQANRT